ncbi:MAG TPA: TonB-dependent receptor [Terriglobales bacterium]|nr:TonB-dependent receptor [Terriglobales bacterium]
MARILSLIISVLILLLCLFSLFDRAFGQDASTGAIRGTVSDPTGGRIPGATVAFANTATGFRYSVVTDSAGRFTLDLLPPGDYSGRAVAPGMSPQVSPRVRVEVVGVTEIEFRLAVAGAKETINVSEAPPLVETSPSAVSSVIDERAISELPLNGRRFTDLALLTPGVTQDPRGLTSASNGDLAFGGIRGFQSSYLVDGADDNNAFFSQARGRYRAPYQFSNEVVKEFRVSSNTYGAELGRAGGAVVNVVTKSGSNHMHGSAFYYLRNSAFDAQHPFMDFKPKSQQQQFGFTAGGPLKRNRAFYYGGIDQHIFRVPVVVRFDNGSPAVSPVPSIYPATPGDYEASDKALVFSAVKQLNGLAGNYPAELVGNTGFFKVDVALNSKNQLTARVNTSRYWGTNNVFFDPSSPLTAYAISDNGQEKVATESASLSLTSALSYHVISHLRAQFSRDLQQSFSNSSEPLIKIYGITDGFGRSSILPRQTREHRLHLAETLSLDKGRNSWKFGGDALLTWIYNYFPSLFGGEYYFDEIKVDPFTFVPTQGQLQLTPLRAFAHQVPRYYIQNFGSAVTHPDTNEYAAFLQDTVRVTSHLALSLGARYDLQTFTKKGLVSNPLWPASGKVPLDTNNFAPRVGLAYSAGSNRPLVIRAGFGLFYTRIPQIYNSTVQSDNGINSGTLFLRNTDFYARQIFPQYPNPLVQCPVTASFCAPPNGILSYMENDISAFAPNFRTPSVQQASLSMEREVANRLAVGISYTYVHGEHLIRARDANLPPPVNVDYPVYDASGTNFLGTYDDVASFSTWQLTRTLTCPYPPCINPLARPIPQLGAIDEFESEAGSLYHGATLSIRRRMNHGMYFRLAYTYGHAVDDGQDALVAGRPSTVQNSYSTASERGPSVTDQRNRFVFSWIADPKPFDRSHPWMAKMFNDWKLAGVLTYGSGRPVDARIVGDANQDGNSSNDRLPGASRNSFLGPDYATTDLRLTRRLFLGDRIRADLIVEAFNLLNRDNQRIQVTDDGFQDTAGQFAQISNTVGINNFPGQFRVPTSFLRPNDAYAARQLQLALRLGF